MNVTNLLLARTAGRYGEIAIRSALGAGRGRLVQQMVTESLLLTVLGGGAGVLLGIWMASALTTIRLPGDLPVRFDFRLDGRVLAYAAAVSLLTGLLVGVLSAVRVSGADLNRALRGLRPLSLQPPASDPRLPRRSSDRMLFRTSVCRRIVRAELVRSRAGGPGFPG